MRRLALALTGALLTIILSATTAYADPPPPTNGGSNLGGGQSGQCAGPLEDRPASCGN